MISPTSSWQLAIGAWASDLTLALAARAAKGRATNPPAISNDAVASAAAWRAGNTRAPVRSPQATAKNTPNAGCNHGKLHPARADEAHPGRWILLLELVSFNLTAQSCIDLTQPHKMQSEIYKSEQLRLNPDNDRHGPLKDEAAAIQWLLDHRSAHMRALAEDLAGRRRLYEPPLVRPDGGANLVFDGNRRICCVKLLINPKLAPSEAWTTFFSELSSNELVGAYATIECEVESDLSTIDEMLFRRHTGSRMELAEVNGTQRANHFSSKEPARRAWGWERALRRFSKLKDSHLST